MSKFLDIMNESVMTPTPTPYAPNTVASECPTTIFIVFGEDNKPLLSNRGVISSAFSNQGLVDNYASGLLKLISGASEVYSIIPELYTQAITDLDDEEFYKYIKDNGTQHTLVSELPSEEQVYIDALDTDEDFNID